MSRPATIRLFTAYLAPGIGNRCREIFGGADKLMVQVVQTVQIVQIVF
jgi:hypothetical protein